MSKKVKIITGAVALVLLICALAVNFVMKAKVDSLEHEKVAEKFSGKDKYTQITLFISEDAGFSPEDADYFKYALEDTLRKKGLALKNDNAVTVIDAYSRYDDMYLESDALRSTKVKTVYIGGNYEFFHSELEGYADITADINHDRVLLSESAAWKLYGGYKLYDFAVRSNDDTYYISGVIEDVKDKTYDSFYGGKSLCIADMTMLDKPITVYELVVINPIKDFAKEAVKASLEIEEGSYLLVENTNRFSFDKIFSKMTKLLDSEKPLPGGVVLSPEENIARRTEKELALLLLLAGILLLFPTGVAVIWIVVFIRFVKRLIRKYIIDKIKEKFSYS